MPESFLKLINPSKLRYVVKGEFAKPDDLAGWLGAASVGLFWKAVYETPVTEVDGNNNYTKFNVNIDFVRRTEAEVLALIKKRLEEEFSIVE